MYNLHMKRSFCTLWRDNGVFVPQFTGAYAPIMHAEYNRRMRVLIAEFYLENPGADDVLLYAAFGDCPCGMQLAVIGDMGYNYVGHHKTEAREVGGKIKQSKSRDDFCRPVGSIMAWWYKIKNKLDGTQARYAHKFHRLRHMRNLEADLP